MAEHPFIIGLARILDPGLWEMIDKNMDDDDWGGATASQAMIMSIESAKRAAAFMLNNLCLRAVEGEPHKSGVIFFPAPGTIRWLKERAREIGVEIEA